MCKTATSVNTSERVVSLAMPASAGGHLCIGINVGPTQRTEACEWGLGMAAPVPVAPPEPWPHSGGGSHGRGAAGTRVGGPHPLGLALSATFR